MSNQEQQTKPDGGASVSTAMLERMARDVGLWAEPGMLTPTRSRPFNEKLIEFGERVSNANKERISELEASLARCLDEAEGWIDDARGCKPEDVMDYDGWAHKARELLRSNAKVSGDGTAFAGLPG